MDDDEEVVDEHDVDEDEDVDEASDDEEDELDIDELRLADDFIESFVWYDR